jgi:hypothetical protein
MKPKAYVFAKYPKDKQEILKYLYLTRPDFCEYNWVVKKYVNVDSAIGLNNIVFYIDVEKTYYDIVQEVISWRYSWI